MRPVLRSAVRVLLLACLLLVRRPGSVARAQVPDAYAQAVHARAALDATPPAQRSRQQYGQVLDRFRAVYRPDRTAPNADAAVEAVAELLAEEGRLFHDPSLLRSAVEQLEFLQRDFAASPFSTPALLTEGELEERDLLDREAARQRFTQFLQSYPHSPLAPQARAELRRLTAEAQTAAPGTAENDNGPITELTSDLAARTRSSRTEAPVPVQIQPQAPPRRSQESVPMAQPAPVPMPRSTLEERDLAPAPPAAPPLSAGSRPAMAGAASPANAASDSTRMVGGIPVFRRAAPSRLAVVAGVRHWSTNTYTRVAVDLQAVPNGDPTVEVPFEASRVAHPDRIFFDLHGVHLAPELAGRAVTVSDGGFLERIRAAQFSGDVVRVVLDVTDVSDYSAFWLPNPSRLIIDIHGRPREAPQAVAGLAPPSGSMGAPAGARLPNPTTESAAAPPLANPLPSADAVAPSASASGSAKSQPYANQPPPSTLSSRAAAAGTPTPRSFRAAAPGTFVAETAAPGAVSAPLRAGDSVAAIAALGQQPSRVRATANPTTGPVAAVAEPAVAAPGASVNSSDSPHQKRKPAVNAAFAPKAQPVAPQMPETDATGGRSGGQTGSQTMVRALGLKVNRIVIDAGHGGHDSGTLGPGGIEEKDVVLDVALRVGKLLKQRLGADVIYTRDDDTFIPLETRTAIANKAQADLFLSIHANSSPDASARGVETYYLNFTTSADALEVAARENAVSDESIHQLSDLVKKITLQDKIAESREFATDVDASLFQGLEAGNAGLKDRGIKKAPFVVLIGANMPSVLAEISFLTNPEDASELRDGAYRQRIAEALYKGVARYERSLNGARLEESAAR